MARARRRGELVALSGASRTGKTTTALAETADSNRLLVCDPKGTWDRARARCQVVTTFRAFRAAVLAAGRGPIRLALLTIDRAAFDAWAACAFFAARSVPTDVVADELASYTNPGKASPGWHRLLSQGLEFGTRIYAITQSPAEADKTCFRNATRIRAFAQRRSADCVAIARELDVAPAELRDLPPLAYIERDCVALTLTRGTLEIPRSTRKGT